MSARATTIDLAITGMTCASCVSRVEKVLARVPGVEAAAVNLATERARVTASHPDLPALIKAVEKAGYTAAEIRPEAPPADTKKHDRTDLIHLIAAAVLSAPLLLGMAIPALMLPAAAQFALASIIQFWLGARFYKAGWTAARALSGNMDLLVALGTTAAWGLSTWIWLTTGHAHGLYFESAALLITFVLFGKWLEAKAKRSTLTALAALTRLRPVTARLLTGTTETELPDRPHPPRRPDRRPPGRAHPRRRPHHARAAAPSTPPCSPARACRQTTPSGDTRRGRRHQYRRPPGHRDHRHRRRDHARPNRPPGGGRPGLESADPAAGGSGQARCSCRWCIGIALATLAAWLLAGAGASTADPERGVGAGDRLPLRPRPRHPDRHHGRHRHGRPPRHPDPRCAGAGARPCRADGGLRQDRDADLGQAVAGPDRAGRTRWPTPLRCRPAASTRWPRLSAPPPARTACRAPKTSAPCPVWASRRPSAIAI